MQSINQTPTAKQKEEARKALISAHEELDKRMKEWDEWVASVKREVKGEIPEAINQGRWDIWCSSSARRLKIKALMADDLTLAEAGIQADVRFDTAGPDQRSDGTNPEDVWRPLIARAELSIEELAKYVDEALSSEEEVEFMAFQEGWRKLFVEMGILKSDADRALEAFCAWRLEERKPRDGFLWILFWFIVSLFPFVR